MSYYYVTWFPWKMDFQFETTDLQNITYGKFKTVYGSSFP